MTELIPELAGLESQITAAKADGADLAKGLDLAQFNWRTAPGTWSIAECLLHLNIVNDRYVHLLETALADARAQGRTAQGPFPFGAIDKWILKNTEPPPTRKIKTGRAFNPTEDQPVTAVLPTFLHLQDQLIERMGQANGLDLKGVKVPAPGFGPLKLNLHVTFAWIAAHGRRHLWQARQVRNNPAFPSSA